ncbi:MAG: ribonuclease HI family protein [Spirochaetales bacterium]|nr:ribonuclease HI family protein [Leptospiraceae bacterium]MCP5483442.1 ribonuclease HI family protein [Spirochaetales bacterium]MCP5486570.1 ribonuclease HI family protein [Spirochaetales bacterium]
MSEDALILYCDGAARGNPGPASIGAVILQEKSEAVVAEVSEAIGRATNNEAEYRALIRGLERAVELKADRLRVRMDSELIVKQILGKYRVRNERLRPLYEEVRSLLLRIPTWSIEHVPRDRNKHADRLANAALDLAQ